MADVEVALCLEQLKGELALFEELAANSVRLRAQDPVAAFQSFNADLEMQASICQKLSELQTQRKQYLSKRGVEPQDMLTVLLAHSDKEEHELITQTLGAYFRRAEQVHDQLELNREFFSVMLGSVESVLDAIVSVDSPKTYDRLGQSHKGAGTGYLSFTS